MISNYDLDYFEMVFMSNGMSPSLFESHVRFLGMNFEG